MKKSANSNLDKEIEDMEKIAKILIKHELKARVRMLQFICSSREYGAWPPKLEAKESNE